MNDRKGTFSSNREGMSEGKLLAQCKALQQGLQQVTAAVFADNRPADRALNLFLRANRQFGSRDRQFISESVFGFFRYLGVLQTLLLPEERRRLWEHGQLPPLPVTTAMLLGAWLLGGGPLPPAATIVWRRQLQLSGTLETELTALVAQLAAAIQRPVPEVEWRQLVPEPLRGAFALSPGQEECFLEMLRRRPPLWLRVQTAEVERLKEELSREGLTVEVHPKLAKALRAGNPRVNLYQLPAFQAGWFEVQDLASQVIGLVCAPGKGERWWDACAGAGGKSLQLADLMQRKGTVVASDIRAYKLEDLRRRARRAAFPNIGCRVWDGKGLRRNQREKFDGVLVDAPCSCSGTWRRNPDARWILTGSAVAEIAALQLRILQAAATGVKSGGILVYATCSMFPQENAGVVNAFLAAEPAYRLEAFDNPLTGKRTDGMLQVYPWDGDCDGMFVARLRKESAPAEPA
ncbi:RsmB/NOP family class I SAM-dependent RNA methyltransferase [Victivallis sp. Marseille-Q1083]|uniref:RsmB/NOP family class I SAM-dependent RNA methyltransferase n=1 Tax=Victivallis sp. Marseille-Q1083 TaxID=2717288 RepID=UPI001588CB76|nr:RsmB/NOP family class I SAM-dependent RNA methyltransferase [Victivallis sp. Marseille-Q1083]